MWCGARATWGLLVGIETAIIGSGAMSAGSGMFGSLMGSKAASKGYDKGIGAMQGMFNTTRAYAEPLMDRGKQIMGDLWPTIQRLITPGADQGAALAEIPGFKFAQEWGQRQAMAAGSQRGLGGNVMKAAADYATGLAGKETFFPMLQALTGMFGQGSGLATNALGTIGGSAGTFGTAIGNMFGQQGQAQGAGIMGAANAFGNFGSSMGNYAMLKGMMGGSGGGGGGGGMYGATPGPWATGYVPYGQ